MKKKILYVITKSNFGGAQRYVYDLASSLPKEKYEAVVAFGGTGAPGSSAGRLQEMLDEANIRTIFIKHFAYDIFLFKEVRALFELVAIFRREKPDVVHLNSSKAGGLGGLAGRIAHVPTIVFTTHGWAFNEPVPLYAKVFRWIVSLITALLSHKLISISHFEMSHAPLALDSTVVHNGVAPFTPLSKKEAREEIKKQFGIPAESFIFGTIAELHPSKGLDTLIGAAKSVPDAHFIVMGEGILREKLETLIKKCGLENRFHLVGFVTSARKYLKGFDVFVLPSKKEGLGYVLLEAGYAELPVVATTVGGIPEIINDGISGVLVPAYDPRSLAKTLTDLMEHPNTRDRYAEELHKKVTRYFNLRGMVKHTIAVYES